MNVSLTPHLENFVKQKVSSGLYNSASEVMREALRLLGDRDNLRKIKLEELRRDIKEGIDQADSGELIDGKAVFDELRSVKKR